MFTMDHSSSASSPFSQRSTDPSSPEANINTNGEAYTNAQKAAAISAGFPAGMGGQIPTNLVPRGLDALMKSLPQTATPAYPLIPAAGPSMSTRPTRTPPSAALKSFTPVSAPPSVRGSSSRNASAAPSLNGASVTSGGAGGSRSEPPRRQMEVEGLPITAYTVDQVSSYPDSNRLLMQGDPQTITKQRVETAIRVILDLLRAIPASPTSPLPSPSLASLLPVDPSGTRWTFDRIGTFRALRLQAGTTTKATSKKQLQAGPLPKEHVAYLETSVYMSGENGKRVYACKRCRLRETRRREHKDAARKKQTANTSGSDSSSSGYTKATRSILPPSPDYITGENADQYDPHRVEQVVEEPIWDPVHADWRHEIVLFNSAPEVAIKDGSCNWLPFRVICYGKCHGEKLGFTIKFTIRTYDGRIVASAYSDPIRITDDHKTDTKVKPKVEVMSSTKPAARPRKGRASAASSRRQSPAPSEGGESVHSVVSEVGAVFTRQTPNVRGNKPYSRPPSQPPTGAPTGPYDFLQTGIIPGENSFQRTTSNTSIPTVASMSALPVTSTDMTGGNRWSRASSAEYPVFDNPNTVAGTVSPNQLRRPNFGFTALDGNPQIPISSAPASTSSSAVASPIAGLRPLSDEALFMNDLNQQLGVMNPYTSFNALDLQSNGLVPNHNPMLYDSSPDIDMAALNTGFEGLLDRSENASLASSYDDTSAFGTGFGDRSSALYSDSGVVPDNMENFLDFSAVETGQDLQQPFGSQMSPPGGAEIPPLPFDFLHSNSPMSVMSPSQFQPDTSPAIPLGPQATVTHVIPAEGPVAGGIMVAIAGTAFTPASVIMFGSRVAKTTFVSEGFVQCVLPASSMSGTVEVAVQGSIRGLGIASQTFTYTGMDKEIMRLALEVRDQYQGASSDAAYRLAQHVANKSNSNSDWSDRGSMSPGGASPFDQDGSSSLSLSRRSSPGKVATPEESASDLQSTLISFLASLDQNAPGSLRRSGAVNHRNSSAQTLLHLSTVMGFHRLARRLIFIGAHLDLQDCNGFTALALASLCGQAACARVLIEAGAAYDRPTSYGEMPLDLAKTGEHAEVEALLLSAVWSTAPGAAESSAGDAVSTLPSLADANSEIDDDNPSSCSDSGSEVSKALRPTRKSRKARGKQRAPPAGTLPVGLRRSASTASLDVTPLATPTIGPLPSAPEDDPPPYDGPPKPASPAAGWMSRTLSNISNPALPGLPDSVFGRLPIPSLWPTDHSEKGLGAGVQAPPQGWVAFPAPSWETLQKMASPEEVKLFTQAMAAAALNAVVQSTSATPSPIMPTREVRSRSAGKRGKSRQNSRSEETRALVKPVKHDRMLYLFWLPILLFVGFWLLVTALPIATGFCLIYARQITRVLREKVKVY